MNGKNFSIIFFKCLSLQVSNQLKLLLYFSYYFRLFYESAQQECVILLFSHSLKAHSLSNFYFVSDLKGREMTCWPSKINGEGTSDLLFSSWSFSITRNFFSVLLEIFTCFGKKNWWGKKKVSLKKIIFGEAYQTFWGYEKNGKKLKGGGWDIQFNLVSESLPDLLLVHGRNGYIPNLT